MGVAFLYYIHDLRDFYTIFLLYLLPRIVEIPVICRFFTDYFYESQ